jgi:hypothetical protein
MYEYDFVVTDDLLKQLGKAKYGREALESIAEYCKARARDGWRLHSQQDRVGGFHGTTLIFERETP